MSINLTDEIEVKTKKGKLGAAKQIFLEGDTQTVEKEIQDINSRHNDLSSKHESLSSTVSEHTKQIESNQSQITANKSAQDAKNTSLEENMKKLNTRDDQITESLKGITASGGASVATAVSYDNTSSHIDAATVQGALDEVVDKHQILSKDLLDVSDLFSVSKEWKKIAEGTFTEEGKPATITLDFEIGKTYVLKISGATPNNTHPQFYTANKGDVVETIWDKRLTTESKTIEFVAKKNASHFRTVCFGGLCSYTLEVKNVTSSFKDETSYKVKDVSDDILDVSDLFSVSKEWKKIAEGTFTEEGKPATITLDFEIGKTYVLKISGATPNNTHPQFYTANKGDVVETIWDKRLTTESKTIEFVAKKNASHFRTVCFGGLCSYTLEVKNVTSSFKDNVLKEIGKVDVLSKQLEGNTESIFNKTYLDTSGHTSIKVNSDGECVADARFFGYRYNDFTVKSGSILNIKTSNHNNSSLVVAIYSEKVVVGINKEKCLQIATYDSATEHNIELKIEHNGYLIFCFNGYQTTPSVSAIVLESYNSVFEQYLYPYKNKKLFVIGDSYTKDAVEHYNKYGKHGYIAAILNKTKMKLCDGTSDVSYSNVCGVSGSQLQRFTPNLLFGVDVFGTKYTYTDVVKNADIVVVFGGTNNYGLGDSNMTLGSFEDKTDDVQIEDVSTDANTLPHTIYGSVKLLVKAIYSLNPTARIIFVTQPERYDDNYGTANVCKLSYPPSDDSVRPYINAGGLTMGNIAGAIKECCSMIGISCIDLHSKLWTYQQCLHYLSNDGLHPNSELGWKIGELIGNYINKLIDINDALI